MGRLLYFAAYLSLVMDSLQTDSLEAVMHRLFVMLTVVAFAITAGGCGAVVGAAVKAPFQAAKFAAQMSTARVKNTIALAEGAVRIADGGVQTIGSTVELIDTIGQTVHHGKMRSVALQQARVELDNLE